MPLAERPASPHQDRPTAREEPARGKQGPRRADRRYRPSEATRQELEARWQELELNRAIAVLIAAGYDREAVESRARFDPQGVIAEAARLRTLFTTARSLRRRHERLSLALRRRVPVSRRTARARERRDGASSARRSRCSQTRDGSDPDQPPGELRPLGAVLVDVLAEHPQPEARGIAALLAEQIKGPA